MVVISLKPLYSTHFGIKPVQGIGLNNLDYTLPIPLPTTILGILGRLRNSIGNNLNDVNNYSCEDFKWVNDNVNTCNDISVGNNLLWGPIVRYNYEDYFIVRNHLIPLSKAKDYIKASINGEKLSIDGVINLRSLIRIGIYLNHQSKTVNLGMTFRHSRTGILNNFEILFEYNGSLQQTKEYIRTGGEMSIGIIEVNNEKKLNLGEDSVYGILLEPLLFSSDGNEAIVGESKGLEDIEEVLGIGVIKAENSKNYYIDKFKVITENLGTGYNETSKARRPLLHSLPSGTVIKVKNKKKAYGLLSNLGFGSAIMVNPNEIRS